MSDVVEKTGNKNKLTYVHWAMIGLVIIILAVLLFLRTGKKEQEKVVDNLSTKQNTRSPSFEAKIDGFKKDNFFKNTTKPKSEILDSNNQGLSPSESLYKLIEDNINEVNPNKNGSGEQPKTRDDFLAEQQKNLYASISNSNYSVIDHNNSSESAKSQANETKSMRASRGEAKASSESVLSMGSIIKVVTRSENSNHYIGSPIFGMVQHDVYDYEKKHILINKGATVIGKIDTLVTTNPTIETKLGLIIEKIKRADGTVIQFDLPASDANGLGGISGDVNKHSFRKWGGFGAFAILSSGLSLGTGNNETPQSSSDDAIGRMKSQVSTNASQASNQFLSIGPTITLPTGSVLSVMIVDDVYVTALGEI